MGKDWKPKCPNCGNACVRNGHNNAPFIVFDQYQNYWLNAPEKFRCRTCEGAEGSKQFSFLTTGDDILKQIGATDPELLDLFQCYVTQKNAIDKKLMKLIIDCTVKEIRPDAMSKKLYPDMSLSGNRKKTSGQVIS